MVRYVAVIASLVTFVSFEAAASAAELAIVNGKVYTADARQREVQALAVSGDRIIAVGSNEEVMMLTSEQTEVIDLGGRRILPGLHDSHIHPAGIVEYEGCNLRSRAMDLEQLAGFVRDCVRRLKPTENEWLAVRQWNFAENNRPAGGFANIRQALDAAAPDNPVILFGNDGHHNGSNSNGLALARTAEGDQVGLSARTLAAEFRDYRQYVGVDERGEPNGTVNESSVELLGAPSILTADLDLITAEAWQVPKRLAALGITSIQDAAFTADLNPFYNGLVSSSDKLTLRIRLAQYLPPQQFTDPTGELDMGALLASAKQTRERYRDHPNIRADALKLFADGVMEGNPLEVPPTLPNSAALKDYHQPRFIVDSESGKLRLAGYVDPQGAACTTWSRGAIQVESFTREYGFHPGHCQSQNGVLAVPEQHIDRFVAAADAEGYSVHVHAIGDRAIRAAVDAIAEVTPATVTTNRHSMAHLQLVADREILRLGELKIPLAMTYAWAVVNPEYDMTVIPFVEQVQGEDGMYDVDSYYYQHFYPVARILQAGGVLAAGSDAPVDSDDPRPFVNIQAAVTRDLGLGSFNPEQRLSILDAIDAYTINGARLMGHDELTGSLEVGKKADFIVLDQDIIRLHASGESAKIGSVKVLQTWFDGQLVYGEELL